ncbi:TonB-dependent receptor [Myxococcus stipitatus]|uniref:TonB-dependent receptor n=1 Tax=Myxococcus stipitatus TaxID=83455 RepID=UPI003145388C
MSCAGLSLHGASALETDYRLDGLSTVDPAFGTHALPLHSGFLSDIDLSWSGMDARSGSATGARIDAMSTPTYFKRFSGSAFISWTPGALEGTRESLGDGDVGPRMMSLENLGDLGGTFTGPIIPKRLAVFLGVAPTLSRARISSASSPFRDQRGVQAVARLTLKPKDLPGHLDLAFITAPTEASRPASVHSTTSRTSLAFTNDSGATRFQVKVGWLQRKGDMEALLDAQAAPPPTDAPWSSPSFSTDRFQASAQVERRLTLVGRHRLSAGLDAEALRYAHATSPLDTGAAVPGPEVRTHGSVLGAYVQDSWEPAWYFLPDVTVGVRYDAQRVLPSEGGPSMHLGEQVSPRLELVFAEPLPWFASRLVARYGSTVSLLPLSLVERAKENPSALVAPTSHDFLLSLQLLVGPSRSKLSMTYLHRRLEAPLDGLLRNPGARATGRGYDGLTVVLQEESGFESFRFYLSYTRSRLTEKGTGRVRAPVAQPTLLDAAVSDRPDSLKLYVLRDFSAFHSWRPVLSVSYLGESGAWMEGAPKRLRSVHTVDVSATLWRLVDHTGLLTLGLDVSNVFNFQAVTRTDATGAPAAYQPPRQLRFQARYAF